MNLRFKIDYFNTSFLVSFLPSDTPVNYRDMPEGNYDWTKPTCYDSIASVKKQLRDYVQSAKLSEAERWRFKDDIKELSIESIIDADISSVKELEKDLKASLKFNPTKYPTSVRTQVKDISLAEDTTGKHIYNDVITLKDDTVIVITDKAIFHYNNRADYENQEQVDLEVIYRHE